MLPIFLVLFIYKFEPFYILIQNPIAQRQLIKSVFKIIFCKAIQYSYILNSVLNWIEANIEVTWGQYAGPSHW